MLHQPHAQTVAVSVSDLQHAYRLPGTHPFVVLVVYGLLHSLWLCGPYNPKASASAHAACWQYARVVLGLVCHTVV